MLAKATALVSVIGLQDMVFRASQAGNTLREPFTFFMVVAVLLSAAHRCLRHLSALAQPALQRGRAQDLSMDVAVIVENLPLYLEGLWTTVQLVALSLACGLALAIPVALLAASRQWFVAVAAKAYIYVFRGTPLLIQMYIIYYGLAQFEAVRESLLWPILREAYWCALLSFALNSAGYTGEILRGAIANTPHGEIEAARSVACRPG